MEPILISNLCNTDFGTWTLHREENGIWLYPNEIEGVEKELTPPDGSFQPDLRSLSHDLEFFGWVIE